MLRRTRRLSSALPPIHAAASGKVSAGGWAALCILFVAVVLIVILCLLILGRFLIAFLILRRACQRRLHRLRQRWRRFRIRFSIGSRLSIRVGIRLCARVGIGICIRVCHWQRNRRIRVSRLRRNLFRIHRDNAVAFPPFPKDFA